MPGLDPSSNSIIGPTYDRTLTVTSVPEPSSVVLSLIGAAGDIA